MSYSIHQAAFPGILQTLAALSKILDKAAAHVKARKIGEADLLSYRLAPDMFNLTRQIQIVTDQAKGCAARLAGLPVPKYEDDETTIRELKQRIAKTVKFVKSIKKKQLEGVEDGKITMQMRSGTRVFTGADYVSNWVMPNFYFHATAAYAILRHAGLELGKRDFLNAA